VYNGVAPSQTTNKILTKEIARILNKPLVLPAIPKIVLQILFGEGSSVILEGSKVSSEKIEKEGFQFQYKSITNALEHLLHKK
jgi:NAD dependent epimerase/dehydratase family enzyme